MPYCSVLILAFVFASFARAADPPLPKEVTRIAFGSCLRQDRPAPIFDAILKSKPDVFIWLGDNIYGDSDDPAVIQAKYEQLGAIEGFQKLREAVPFLYVWDDHDYGRNDAGVEYPFKEQNKKLMLDFFGEPQESVRRKRPGNYDSVIIGPKGKRVQFLLLDTRSFRSPMKSETRDKKKYYVPTDDPNATILGEAQWAWLEEQMKQPAEVRVICTSIQLVNDAHRFEKWGNFPVERARLLRRLAEIDPATQRWIVLSGDRHHGSMHTAAHGHAVEVTASALNQGGTPSREDFAAPGLIGKPTGESNFGYVEIDWAKTPPALTVQLRDASNAVLINAAIADSGSPNGEVNRTLQDRRSQK
jgi:alkaline phosphatase D